MDSSNRYFYKELGNIVNISRTQTTCFYCNKCIFIAIQQNGAPLDIDGKITAEVIKQCCRKKQDSCC